VYSDLASYVDYRVHLAKKAYPSMTDREIVRDTVVSLPPELKSRLNLMSDTSKIHSVREFNLLAASYDQQIDLQTDTNSSQPLDRSTFSEPLRAAVQEAIAATKKVDQATIAAVTSHGQGQRDTNQPVGSQGTSNPNPNGGAGQPHQCEYCGCHRRWAQRFERQGVLTSGGKGTTLIKIIGCLHNHEEPLVVREVEANGHRVSAVIDTGAIAAFIPLRGVIMAKLQPASSRSQIKLKTVLGTAHQRIGEVLLRIRPWRETMEPVPCKAIVIDTCSDILGSDMVLGLPALKALRADVSMRPWGCEVRWSQQEKNVVPSTGEDNNASPVRRQEKEPDAFSQTAALTRTEGQTLDRDRPLAISYISGSAESRWTAEGVCDKNADVFTDTLAGSVIRLPAACIHLSNYRALSCRARRHSRIS